MKNYVKLFLAAGTAMICNFQVYSQTSAAAPQTQTPAATPAATENMVSLGENVKMKIGGFLRADMYYDTRLNAEAVDGLFNFYPLGEQLDSFGKDINASPQLRMAGTASRLNSKFSGPDVLNAKSTAMIEFDFTGIDGIGLRLRHAWVKLNWEKSELLFGRFWHPLFILEAFPSVVALSTGAPFTAFNRCEQIRYTMNYGNISFFGAASAQMIYGLPDKKYYHPIPDFSANVQFKNNMIILGATGNIKTNQPEISYTYPANNDICKTDDVLSSYAVQGYGQIKFDDLKIKGGVLYGQNMHEFLMVGGYAVESQDSIGNRKYTTLNTMNYWGNIIYGKDLQFSMFFGYLKNMGFGSKTIVGAPIGRGSNIDNSLRLAPSITYKSGRVLFQLELEHNIAAYGSIKDNTGAYYENLKVKDAKSVSNTRLQFATTFMF